MLIPKDELNDIFEQIHNVWIQTGTSVIILSAADCDSICTTQILTSLLRAENITWKRLNGERTVMTATTKMTILTSTSTETMKQTHNKLRIESMLLWLKLMPILEFM